MGQVDCWPMQCPPMLPVGVGSCTDSTASAFADYNNPVADCCAPRCDSKVASLVLSVTTTPTTMPAGDPCLQHPSDTDIRDDNDSGGGSSDIHSNNHNTTPPATGKPCFYGGRAYQSGARWDDPVDICTSCDCKVNKKWSMNVIYSYNIKYVYSNISCKTSASNIL